MKPASDDPAIADPAHDDVFRRAAATLMAIALGASASAQDVSAPEEIALTVHADGTTAVREVRSVQLVAGDCRVHVFEISPQLFPETVALRSLATPGLLELREQSLWFEVLDEARALERAGGRPITLFRYHESGVEKFEGRLLFPPVVPGPHGEVRLPLYLEQPEGRIRLLEGGEVELDSLPPGDWNRLRLDWRLTCKRTDRYRFEVLYLTSGLAWHADWLLRIGTDGATADVECVATVENQLGVAWRNCRLAFAEAAQAIPWHHRAEGAERPSALAHAAPDPVTIEARRSLQVVLASAHDVAIKGAPTLFIARDAANGELPVVRRFDLVNGGAEGLGRPLPAGAARVLQLDAKNRPLQIGARPLPSVAAGETISFAGDPVPGLTAEVSQGPVSADGVAAREIEARLWSERDERTEVEILVPLAIGEIAASENPAPLLDRPGLARFVVPVLPRSSAKLHIRVNRP